MHLATPTTNKVLLLDFDGVMLVNSRLKDYQSKRSAKFVCNHTLLHPDHCKIINSTYYPKYGHSVIMVQKLFDQRATLQEYNDYVFSMKQLKRLQNVPDEETKNHMQGFKKVYDYCESVGMPCYVFTNAHKNWVTYFTDVCGLDIDPDTIIYPEHLDFLKPNANAYDRVEKQFGVGSEYLFIDDAEVNLNIPSQRTVWHPFHFLTGYNSNWVYHTIETHINSPC